MSTRTVTTTESAKFAIIDAFCKRLQSPPAGFPTIKETITIDGVRILFDEGWALLRASNTTPMLVTRFESTRRENLAIYEKALRSLLDSVMEELR